jgi:hypothetical protein
MVKNSWKWGEILEIFGKIVMVENIMDKVIEIDWTMIQN